MAVLVETILGVIPKMASVAMLCGFMFVVFGQPASQSASQPASQSVRPSVSKQVNKEVSGY